MVSSTLQTIATNDSLGHVTRPGRALIGWMPEAEACLMLSSRRVDLAHSPENRAKAEQARAAVQTRAPFGDHADVVLDPDDSLAEYISAFTAQPDFRPFAAEGWAIKIANLSKVCALQPMVFWDHSQERTQEASAESMHSVATITLPVRTGPDSLPIQFDEARNTWIVTSRNPNLRVIGHFSVPVQSEDGRTVLGCGFALAVTASFVQVVRARGRFLLRDGYHRAIGLLARGVTHAPVLFRDFGDYQTLGLPVGMLPETAYFGQRPPMLSDYLTDVVSAEIRAPASQKDDRHPGHGDEPFGLVASTPNPSVNARPSGGPASPPPGFVYHPSGGLAGPPPAPRYLGR